MNKPFRSKIVFVFIALLLLADGMVFLFWVNGADPLGDYHSLTASSTPQSNPTGVWESLLLSSPQAYTTPLPPSDPTPLDGIYAKLVESEPQYWLCLRCADYRQTGGIWKLQFERGVMRILYDVTGWHSLASFTANGDELTIFNDPYCPDEVGKYKWSLQDGPLNLRPVADACAFSLRAENLSLPEWELCPEGRSVEPKIINQLTPAGCITAPDPVPVSQPDNLKVQVYPGDSRFFENPPEVFALANQDDVLLPDGIQLAHHPDSISYGLNRVLWWRGNWIEASTSLPFRSMGVQFFGSPSIGWARMLFDGVEVWHGDTAAIWSKNGLHGGYVEVSGFEPGEHTLRIESLDFGYRPVTVASFGFR